MRKKDYMAIHDIVGNDNAPPRTVYQSWSFSLHNFQKIVPKGKKDFPKHVHNSFELIIPIGKQYRCMFCEREIVVPHGSFILIQPGQSHVDHLSKSEPFFCIHFSLWQAGGKKIIRQMFVPGLFPENQIAEIPSPVFANDVFALVEKFKDKEIAMYFYDYFFLAMLHFFLGAYPVESLLQDHNTENIRSVTYQRIYRYFESCLSSDNKFSLTGFCKVMNCSSRTLSRICNEYFFMPPKQAFQKYKLNSAMRFLQENPNAEIKEAAAFFGFPNAFYFSKMFKKNFGISPSRVKYEIK